MPPAPSAPKLPCSTLLLAAASWNVSWLLFEPFWSTVAVAPLLFPKLGYDPLRDLAPVTMLVTMPFIVVAHPSMPVRNARELIAWAKANPGKVNMASGGAGTGQHLAGELFNLMAGIRTVHVPYKGTAPAIADMSVMPMTRNV